MTIKRKIEKQDLKKHSDMISRGAKVIEDISKKKQWKTICLRITSQLIDEIDQQRNIRIGINRNAWILQAIQEKLKEDR